MVVSLISVIIMLIKDFREVGKLNVNFFGSNACLNFGKLSIYSCHSALLTFEFSSFDMDLFEEPLMLLDPILIRSGLRLVTVAYVLMASDCDIFGGFCENTCRSLHEFMIPQEQNVFTCHILNDSFLAIVRTMRACDIHNVIHLDRVSNRISTGHLPLVNGNLLVDLFY